MAAASGAVMVMGRPGPIWSFFNADYADATCHPDTAIRAERLARPAILKIAAPVARSYGDRRPEGQDAAPSILFNLRNLYC
jgi:hypothetical protein